jgi:hypothetical protein
MHRTGCLEVQAPRISMFAELATGPMPPRLARATSAPQRRHDAGSIDLRNPAFPPSCAPLKSWGATELHVDQLTDARAGRWITENLSAA